MKAAKEILPSLRIDSAMRSAACNAWIPCQPLSDYISLIPLHPSLPLREVLHRFGTSLVFEKDLIAQASGTGGHEQKTLRSP